MGRVSFIILELGAQKGRWVMEQAFHGDFQVSVTLVFLAVSPVSLTELCSFWYSLKDLFSLHKIKWTKLFLTVKSDDVTRGRWDRG